MHHTAKRCVQWAVGLWVLGALALIYGTQVYLALAESAGASAGAGLSVVNVVLTIVRSATFPMGAALAGAAVVIQTLVGRGQLHEGRANEPAPRTGQRG